ncbi:MAG: CoB--CoM heterodisulfide reductase iron-sulfur subunit B family protein [Thermoplasmata archaeon]
MKIPYFPGCSLKSDAAHFEQSAIEFCKAIGVELVELPNWNCCGTVHSLTTDDIMHHLACFRNLIHAQELGKELGTNKLITLCAMCYNTLAQVNELAKRKPDDLKTANEFIDDLPDYEAKVEVLHLLTFLNNYVSFEKIAKVVKGRLNGLKVAPYYGCLLVRPEHVKIDDRERPVLLSKLLNLMGAKTVEFPYAVECCGSYHTVNLKEAVVEKTYTIINNARENGAEAIVLSCPLCEFNLDKRQRDVKAAYPTFEPMPVFYFTELLALAGGKKINVNAHYVSPENVLAKYKL